MIMMMMASRCSVRLPDAGCGGLERTVRRFAAIMTLLTAIGCANGGSGATSDEPPDQTEAEPMELVVEHPDGSVTLYSPLDIHLITHLRSCLIQADYELLYDQLLADRAKQTYVAQGLDPRQSIQWFSDNRRDILILLNRMGQGMNSPDVYWENLGPVLRLKLHSGAARSMRFSTIDITREGGNFKLVHIE